MGGKCGNHIGKVGNGRRNVYCGVVGLLMIKRRFTGRLGKTSNHTIRKLWEALKEASHCLDEGEAGGLENKLGSTTRSPVNIMKASASDVGVAVPILIAQGMRTNGEHKMPPPPY